MIFYRLGRKGRTIILSIHQPRYSIFRLFDSLTLLSLGRLTYHGSYDEVLPYFESLGKKSHAMSLLNIRMLFGKQIDLIAAQKYVHVG